MFEPGSRYESVPDGVHVDAGGREIPYKLLRIVPQPPPGEAIDPHIVKQGDRLDLLAYGLLGDPGQLWRIADANRATRPDRLTDEPGRALRLPRPEGGP